MIELRGVHKRFGKQVVLNGVDFEVREGETVALLGPSGTGKSVLLKHIIGLIQPDQGTIIVDGKDVGRLKRKELTELRSHIGYVFQNGALFDSMNVFENVRLGITDEDKYGDLDYVPGADRRVHPAGEPAGRHDREVSRRSSRAACGSGSGIARAIAGSPKYLLYDEPTSGLDPVNADIIDGLVQRLDDELGRHQRHGDARRARRLPGGRPAGAAQRGQDRHAGHAEGVPATRRTRRSGSSSSATSTTPPSRPEPTWICVTGK